ncbi:unnamed protein product [Schistosoma mattheei]|uniref:Uncharacterized protein n=1 Tax=Schistosoma mattheei TaxID=31246 RepID=A0A3P8K564_9TREM|nr:unnamed protein product [Schistosoma mattheei]
MVPIVVLLVNYLNDNLIVQKLFQYYHIIKLNP